MALRDKRVDQVMTTQVVSFTADQNVEDAMARLLEAGVDAGPVVDTANCVVGMLSTGDLIVEEARLHFPTIVNFLGVNITLPFNERNLDESIEKALGASVGDVMTEEVLTVGPHSTIEDAATLMYDNNVSRLPVVAADGSLVGIIARGDIVKAIIGDERAPGSGSSDAEQ